MEKEREQDKDNKLRSPFPFTTLTRLLIIPRLYRISSLLALIFNMRWVLHGYPYQDIATYICSKSSKDRPIYILVLVFVALDAFGLLGSG